MLYNNFVVVHLTEYVCVCVYIYIMYVCIVYIYQNSENPSQVNKEK